jgi:hypothetical protein
MSWLNLEDISSFDRLPVTNSGRTQNSVITFNFFGEFQFLQMSKFVFAFNFFGEFQFLQMSKFVFAF